MRSLSRDGAILGTIISLSRLRCEVSGIAPLVVAWANNRSSRIRLTMSRWFACTALTLSERLEQTLQEGEKHVYCISH
jgi:hypothetical protein